MSLMEWMVDVTKVLMNPRGDTSLTTGYHVWVRESGGSVYPVYQVFKRLRALNSKNNVVEGELKRCNHQPTHP